MEETNRPRILVKLFKENKHGKMRKYLEFLSGKEFISDDEPAELLFADNDFQSLQVEGISSIQYTLENTTLQSDLEYTSKDFLEFVLNNGLIPFIAQVLKLKISPKYIIKDGTPWQVVHYHCAIIIRFIVNYFLLKDEDERSAICTDEQRKKFRQAPTSHFLKEILEENCIENLFQVIEHAECVVSIIASANALRMLAENEPEVCEKIIEIDGIQRLTHFVKRDKAQEYLLQFYNKKLLPYQEKLLDRRKEIDYGDFDLSTRWKAPPQYKNEPVYYLILQLGHDFQTDAVCCLTKIAALGNKARQNLYDDKATLKAVVQWIKEPVMVEPNIILVQHCLDVVMNISFDESLGVKLLEEHQFISALEIGLMHADWRLVCYFSVALIVFVKQGGRCSEVMAANEDLAHLVVGQMFAFKREIQESNMHVVLQFANCRIGAKTLYRAGLTLPVLEEFNKYWGEKFVQQYTITKRGLLRYLPKEFKKDMNVPVRDPVKAEKLKDHGNEMYKLERYKDAIRFYTKAISLCPLATKKKNEDGAEFEPEWTVLPAAIYCNRAQCYLKEREWTLAVKDCSRAMSHCFKDKPCEESINLLYKAAFRRSKALCALNEYHKALNDIAFVRRHSPSDDFVRGFYTSALCTYRKNIGNELVRHCANCGAGEGLKLKRCANCLVVYCSAECQQEDWKNGHKKYCDPSYTGRDC